VRLNSSARESIVNYWAGTKLRSLSNRVFRCINDEHNL
jgi:hypothetical protein